MHDQPIEPTSIHPQVARLRELMKAAAYKAAIVDTLGRVEQDPKTGHFVKIGPGHPGRFELRSAQHVAVYGFKVVEWNRP